MFPSPSVNVPGQAWSTAGCSKRGGEEAQVGRLREALAQDSGQHWPASPLHFPQVGSHRGCSPSTASTFSFNHQTPHPSLSVLGLTWSTTGTDRKAGKKGAVAGRGDLGQQVLGSRYWEVAWLSDKLHAPPPRAQSHRKSLQQPPAKVLLTPLAVVAVVGIRKCTVCIYELIKIPCSFPPDSVSKVIANERQAVAPH